MSHEGILKKNQERKKEYISWGYFLDVNF